MPVIHDPVNDGMNLFKCGGCCPPPREQVFGLLSCKYFVKRLDFKHDIKKGSAEPLSSFSTTNEKRSKKVHDCLLMLLKKTNERDI